MKIMVTGGAGFVGGTTAALLSRLEHSVLIVDNFCHSQKESLPRGIDYIQSDIADRYTIESIFRDAKAAGEPFDAVLHFAALIEAGESMKYPEVYFRANTAATLALLESVTACGPKRFVFSSTAAVYGEPEAVPIPESAPLRPTNPYGESKLLVEQMLNWFHKIHGLRSASLRYFNVAGAPEVGGHGTGKVVSGEAHEPESHIIPLVLDVALGRRKAIKIFGNDYQTADGTCVRDYVHVSDLADAHLLALEALETDRAARQRLVYNLGNGAGFTVQQVIESARRVTGHPIPVEIEPRRAGDPAFLIAASEKAICELNWKPNYPKIDDILRTAWIWHQKRYIA